MQHRISRTTPPLLMLGMGLLLLASALVAPTAPAARALTNCDVADYSLDSTELEFLDLINQYRSTNGLTELTLSTNLNRAAHWMGDDLGTNAYFNHTDSLGRSPYGRAIDCGYPAGAGENLAAGAAWSSAQSAFNAWQNSPGHNANMLGAYYRQIGIARVQVSGSPYTWYWVTNFGTANDGTGGGGGGSTPTNTPTSTSTSLPQATNTPTNTPTSTPTKTPTPTSTPAGATATPTNPPAPTATPTPTPSAPAGGAGTTPTSSPTPTPTKSITPPIPGTPTATATPSATATPPPSTTPSATASPTTTPPPAGSLALRPGANLVGWTGATGHPRDALRSVESSLRVVYGYDSSSGRWLRYGPDLPPYVNTLDVIESGEAYWVFLK